MPIIATKTIIALTAAATAIGSMIGGGVVGDIDQTYIIASDYAETKIELVIEEMVENEFSRIDSQRLGTGGNL